MIKHINFHDQVPDLKEKLKYKAKRKNDSMSSTMYMHNQRIRPSKNFSGVVSPLSYRGSPNQTIRGKLLSTAVTRPNARTLVNTICSQESEDEDVKIQINSS